MNRETPAPLLQPSSRWALFVILDGRVLEAVVHAAGSKSRTDKADHSRSNPAGQEKSLRTYRKACILREVGYYFGVFAFLAAMVAFIIVGISAIPGVDTELFVNLATLLMGLAMLSIVAWSVLYWVTALAFPSTRLSKHVRELEYFSRPGKNGMDRAGTIQIMRTSGKVARSLFRILTQKTINVGVRPDFADDVARICQSVMIRKPSSTGASYAGKEREIDEHVNFLREVVALVVLDRLDLLPKLRTAEREAMLLDLDTADSSLREYLQPFHGDTTLRVIRQDILPLVSITIALIAVVLTIFHP